MRSRATVALRSGKRRTTSLDCSHRRVAGFLRGIGVIVVEVLAGKTCLIGMEAIGDWLTIIVASLVAITFWKKIQELGHPGGWDGWNACRSDPAASLADSLT